ncbi:ultraviolet-B receptor UVR8 isoform X2 [Mangifera indica]|uniref:ultraviolet-B receptor UVR8 isoform X2 n=1 Tax=Mangifera indica TaxID=29780 RepID=UPI001CF93141|nr:ultraviolet-B receptor UVR8 isoform X2 [Mangifera indica]
MEEIEVIESSESKEEEQRVWSWGAGTDGQLGTGCLRDELSPQLLQLPFSVSALACGGGQVFSWGRGTSGQLGHGDMANCSSPKPISFFEDYSVTQLSAGWNHSGFVSDSGCLFTCGDGSFGQLGHGDYISHYFPRKVSYFINNNVQQIACGMRHSLVLVEDCLGNQVYGFGSGKRGQLGISLDKIRSFSLPCINNGFEDVEIVSISANGDHSAALSADGHLYTWGKGFSKMCDSYIPQRLSSSLCFLKAALGWNHALLLTGGGEAYMLGGSTHGTLSDPEKMSPVKPLSENSKEAALEKVSGLDDTKVVQIAAGAEHSALVTDSGIIMTWGWGEHGQLGLGNTCDQIKPRAVSLDDEVQSNDAAFQVYCGSGFTYTIRTLSLSS